jgi:hypothetical protein
MCYLSISEVFAGGWGRPFYFSINIGEGAGQPVPFPGNGSQ